MTDIFFIQLDVNKEHIFVGLDIIFADKPTLCLISCEPHCKPRDISLVKPLIIAYEN